MKTTIIVTAFLLLGVTAAFISIDKSSEAKGPHGGKLKRAGEFNIELKTSYPDFYAYLLDKKYGSTSNKGITCEIKFMFPDSTFQDISLKPYQEDGFKMVSTVSGYYSYRVVFNVSGKYISANFEDDNVIVHK